MTTPSLLRPKQQSLIDELSRYRDPEVRTEHIRYPSRSPIREMSRVTIKWDGALVPVVLTATDSWWKIYRGTHLITDQHENDPLHVILLEILRLVDQDLDED